MLEVQGLYAGYEKGKQVLKDITFSAVEGQVLAVLGPNGSGKSTLLKALCGWLGSYEGSIRLKGQELKYMKDTRRAGILSAMLTAPLQSGRMSCEEVVAMGRYPYTGPMGRLEENDLLAVEKAMERTDTKKLAKREYGKISDGQKQRVRLAAALAQEPEILLLDEPTAFLDIRYQLEFLRMLKEICREKQILILLTLQNAAHALQTADRLLMLKEGEQYGFGPVEDYSLRRIWQGLYDMEDDLLAMAEGQQPAADTVFRYGKELRCGYTTGSCAAAAASAAAALLLNNIPAPRGAEVPVQLRTPAGKVLYLQARVEEIAEDHVIGSVEKDAGDDPDVTDGMRIMAKVQYGSEGDVEPDQRIEILGGEGIGRVSRPGLDQPVGEAAINSIPRRMIREAVGEEMEKAGYAGKMQVIVSAPGGEEIAKKTFNPELGIMGGISILGSSGIVEPMSEKALVDTLRVQLSSYRAQGRKRLILTPGKYGQAFLKEHLGLDIEESVKCGNFVGEALDMALSLDFQEVLLVGHLGKLVKLGSGIMNTHSREADGRMETLAACYLRSGGEGDTSRRILNCNTTEEAVELLKKDEHFGETMKILSGRMVAAMQHRCYHKMKTAVIFFSLQQEMCVVSDEAAEMLERGMT